MRLRTRKLLTPELITNGAQPSDERLNEPRENTSAGETQENSDGSINRDSQVVSAALGGYAFPAPSRYDDDSWDSDTMLVAWASRNQFACFDADLYIGSGRTLEGVCGERESGIRPHAHVYYVRSTKYRDVPLENARRS